MIELTVMELVLGVLGVGTVLLVLSSWLSCRDARHKERTAMHKRVVCHLCLHVFENQGPAKLVDCPACGAKNERGRDRRLG